MMEGMKCLFCQGRTSAEGGGSRPKKNRLNANEQAKKKKSNGQAGAADQANGKERRLNQDKQRGGW